MSPALVCSLVAVFGFVAGAAFGAWDRCGIVKALRTELWLCKAQQRAYERELVSTRAIAGIKQDEAWAEAERQAAGYDWENDPEGLLP